jgi:preprotein translocase subunit Sec61beta
MGDSPRSWTIASIPAAIIVIGILVGILLVLTIFFGGVSQLF